MTNNNFPEISSEQIVNIKKWIACEQGRYLRVPIIPIIKLESVSLNKTPLPINITELQFERKRFRQRISETELSPPFDIAVCSDGRQIRA